MRKRLKKQIQEMSRLLGQLHSEIKNKLILRQKDDVLDFLEHCQNVAITMGKTIEQEEGEGFITISLLEKYCETVYQIYESLCKSFYIDINRTYEELKRSHIQIDHSIKDDIKVHIEIVFLPYKASMWDSLESVWKTAREDPCCRAYVVPIPYFDKSEDGTLVKIHDESNLYPKDIPVISWETYDIAVRHPDVIFIHSPYDSGNFVTTIHPAFYSDKLKKHTELLVYIPYFITLGGLPEDFCVTLGSFNADRVIVQSENVRQNYIYAFQSFLKKESLKAKYKNIEKKFLALGSPKYDKVMNSMPEDFELPDRWKHLIISDGIRKKVVFYNTSLNAMLSGNEQYLKKIRSVLKIFSLRNDVTLWWRPHPLSKATIGSMRPKLLQEYEQIVNKYQQEGWGIYDDTPELHRAIAWSDAYYGDTSSVAMLFQAAGKPVMLQEIDDLPLAFENFIQAGDNYWFTGFNLNGLFRLDTKTWKADFMGCFPKEKDVFRLFYSIAYAENILVFVPFAAEAIALYKLDTSEFISIPIQPPVSRETPGALETSENSMPPVIPYFEHRKFTVCAVYNGYAFMFPCTYPAIIKLNLKTYETEYLYDPVAKLAKMALHPQSYYFRKGKQIGNIIRLWYVAANVFLEFNMDVCQFKVCGNANGDDLCTEFVYDGMDFWMFPNSPNRTLKKFSGHFEEISSIDLCKCGITEGISYLHAIDTEDAIYAFPATAGHVIKIDKKHGEVTALPMLDPENVLTYQGASTDWKFFIAKKCGDTIFAYDAFAQKLVSYNFVTDKVEKKAIQVSQEVYADTDSLLMVWEMYYERITQVQELSVREERRKNLNAFLELLSKRNRDLLKVLHKTQKRFIESGELPATGDSGRSIYEYTKNYLMEKTGENL